jgi:hypothetical protein
VAPRARALRVGGGGVTLRERCRQFLDRTAFVKPQPRAEELEAFVVAETGRTADTRLEDSLPLAIYFRTKEDREEFVAAVLSVNPNMVMRRL